MSDPEEDEDDMTEDKDSTCSGIASEDKDDEDRDGEDEVVVADFLVADLDRDGDGETRGEDEEEDSSDDFFDADEGAVIGPDRLSLRAASESGQSGSGGGTEDDPVGPITPSATATSHITTTSRPQWTFHHARVRRLQRNSTTKSGRPDTYTTYASRIRPIHCIPTPDHCQN